MDSTDFDALSRRLAEALTRRGMLRAGTTLAASVVPALALALSHDVASTVAKKKRKKKRKKKKRPPSPPPPPPACGGECPNDAPQCCPPTTQDPQGICALADDVCCTSEEGGSACSAEFPQCCPPTTLFENGFCTNLGDTCCPSDKGGYLCPSGNACCATNDDCPQDSTCEQNCCLPDGAPRSRMARPSYDVRRRR